MAWRWILCVGWLVMSISLSAQLPAYNPMRFTIGEGLPSNECHSIVQDSKGYVWVATDRGLSRWDGYAFRNYSVKDGLEDLSIFNLYKDTNNDIWVVTSSAKLYIYQQHTGKIVPYKYNDLYSYYRRKVKNIKSIIIDEARKLYLVFQDGNIMSISDEGCVEILSNRNEYVGYDIIQIEGREFFNKDIFDSDGVNKPQVEWISLGSGDRTLFVWPFPALGLLEAKDFDINNKTINDLSVFSLGVNNSLVFVGGKVFHYKDQKVVQSRACNAAKDILVTSQGEIYTAESLKGGVKYYRNLGAYMADVYTVVMPDVSASRIAFDGKGGLWIATLEDGVIHARRSNFEQLYLGDNGVNRVTEVEASKDGTVYVVNNDANLIQLNTIRKELTTALRVPTEIMDLKLDNTGSQLLVSSAQSLVISKDERIQLHYQYDFLDYPKSISTGSKRVGWDDNGDFYLIGYRDFYVFDNNLKQLINPCLVHRRPTKVIFAISSIDECTYLIGSNDGLELNKDGKYHSLLHISPLFSTRVNEIVHKGNIYYIATQGQGLLMVEDLFGLYPKIDKYDTSLGMLSDNIENITVDEKGRIYLSTFAGFNILSRDTILKDYKIKSYTMAHGLPSNEVNDIAVSEDKVYIATGNGLVLLSEHADAPSSRSPIIENIQVNDTEYNAEQLPSKFGYKQNNMIINFKTIDLSLSGKILYRYGFDKNNLEETYATSVNYNDLGSGIYTFYVQSRDRDQRWSDLTKVSFAINRPWWESPYFIGSVMLLLIGLAYIYFKSKIAAIEAKNEVALELISLERSALQAQMNPHFIFNCLNSIQNYIMKNDKEIAMEFLNKFAHLIRQTLNLSASSEVTLEEEVNVLENYLSLEKMRFKDSFSYEINIAREINTQRIKFPPLLLQPFVENAIIHGANTAMKDAKISIDIDQTETHLMISILDNGNGSIQNVHKHNYKSMGMDITRKRLNFVNKYAGDHYTITPRQSEIGTEVVIKLLLTEVSF